MRFRNQTTEKGWKKYLDKPDKNGLHRCVYCGHMTKYQGSCRQCGEAEDAHLGLGLYAE